jgi:autoaggregation protein RapA/B/C
MFVAVAICLLGWTPCVSAQTDIDFTNTGVSIQGYPFGSVIIDPTTGEYYTRSGYGPGYGSSTLTVYANQAAFLADTPSGTITLQGGGPYGTYFAVNNGILYGRTDDFVSAYAAWSLTTGNETSVGSIPTMGGANGSQTFNWGGFSGVNFLQDSTGIYLFGANQSGSGWQLNSMNGTNVVSADQFATPLGNLGYAFMIDGVLFTGPSYYGTKVTEEMPFSTGVQTSANIDLTGLPGGVYIDDIAYDSTSNTLYVVDAFGGPDSSAEVYEATDASQRLGLNPPPEPSTAILWLTGIVLMIVTRKRLAQLLRLSTGTQRSLSRQ